MHPRLRPGRAYGAGALLAALAVWLVFQTTPAPPSSLTRAVTALPSPQPPVEALLARDRKLLVNLAAERLDQAMEPLFADFQQRVPEFADWAFRWRTSYALLRSAAVTTATKPFAGGGSPALGLGWEDLIFAKFDELILLPAGGLPALNLAHDRWRAGVRSTLDEVAGDTLRTLALLSGRVPPPLPEEVAAAPAAPGAASALAGIRAVTEYPIKIRVARPLVTRLTIRPPVAALVTAAGEVITGGGELALLGGMTSFAVTLGGFLGIDYLLSRADAAASQEDLVVELRRALELERETLRHQWMGEIERDIDRRLAQVRQWLPDPGDASESPLPTTP